jgi:predicted secreted protein
MAEEDIGINGADFLLYVNVGTEEAPDYQPLAGQRGASRELSAATIDVSHKLDKHERFLPGRLSSTLSFDGLWAETDSYLALLDAQDAQELILVRIVLNGEPWKEATGFITNMSEGFPDQEGATFSANFQVSGAWRDVESS